MEKIGLLSDKYHERVNKLPSVMRYVVNVLLDCIDNIINGDCDEDTIVSTMATLENNTMGRYCDADLLNYDQAGDILGFGYTNRVGLKRLLDNNNIHQVTINNIKCGFRRSKIMALRDKLNEDIRKREMKRINKEKKALMNLKKGRDKERGY